MPRNPKAVLRLPEHSIEVYMFDNFIEIGDDYTGVDVNYEAMDKIIEFYQKLRTTK